MADELRVESRDGVLLTYDPEVPGHVYVQSSHNANPHDSAALTPSDLHWLVTTGGPAMIALLGGPLAIKGADDGR
jgi:hypothetical protein